MMFDSGAGPVEQQHERLMDEAIGQAHLALDHDDVPVGAVIVHEGRIVAKAHNQVELLKDPTAHAEMIAITQAAHTLSTKWIYDCTMYVTIEPCSMCAGALVLARLGRLYIGAADPKTGACGSIFDIAASGQLNHQVAVCKGLKEDVCGGLLTEFFQKKREKAANKNKS